MQEIDSGLFYETNKYYLDFKKWKLWDNNERRDGKYLDAYYKFNKLKAGFTFGKYEGYTYLFPYLEYSSNYTYKFYQKITGKEQKSFCAVDKHLTTSTFEISKYKGYQKKYKEMTKYWWSTALSNIKSNNQFTPQFQYLLKQKDLSVIENYFYISGWYQFDSNPNDCYYSPNFTDNTLLEWHPVYKGLEGIFKYGYSFKDSVYLKSYGFDYQDKFISFDCTKNYSFKSGTSAYWYEECNLKAGVKW